MIRRKQIRIDAPDDWESIKGDRSDKEAFSELVQVAREIDALGLHPNLLVSIGILIGGQQAYSPAMNVEEVESEDDDDYEYPSYVDEPIYES